MQEDGKGQGEAGKGEEKDIVIVFAKPDVDTRTEAELALRSFQEDWRRNCYHDPDPTESHQHIRVRYPTTGYMTQAGSALRTHLSGETWADFLLKEMDNPGIVHVGVPKEIIAGLNKQIMSLTVDDTIELLEAKHAALKRVDQPNESDV